MEPKAEPNVKRKEYKYLCSFFGHDTRTCWIQVIFVIHVGFVVHVGRMLTVATMTNDDKR